jgi:hypothetical protein
MGSYFCGDIGRYPQSRGYIVDLNTRSVYGLYRTVRVLLSLRARLSHAEKCDLLGKTISKQR